MMNLLMVFGWVLYGGLCLAWFGLVLAAIFNLVEDNWDLSWKWIPYSIAYLFGVALLVWVPMTLSNGFEDNARSHCGTGTFYLHNGGDWVCLRDDAGEAK